MVGQRQGGFLGLVERAVDRGAHHIWFERAESKDRNSVAKKLIFLKINHFKCGQKTKMSN
jgi:hypothetical protein